MKLPPFDNAAPATLGEAIAVLAGAFGLQSRDPA